MDIQEKSNLLYQEWAKEAKDIGTNRFLASHRIQLVEDLISRFHSHSIPIDDVMIFKRKIKDILITQEGMKGNGKHKGWKDCLENEFEAIVSSAYLKAPTAEHYSVVRNKYNSGNIIPRNKTITRWSRDKFSTYWNESINLLCHTVGHELNNEFCKEILNG